MPIVAHSRKFIPALPRDFFRRRRAVRRLTTIAAVALLSVAAAIAIVHQSGAPAFSVPGSPQKTPPVAPAPAPAMAPVIPPVVSAADPPATGSYKLEPGPYQVTEISDFVLHDAHRNKDLHIRLFYPSAAGEFPVIVFSHGAGGSQNCCEELTGHWASYGYLTIQPTHADSTTLRRNQGQENIRFPQALHDALNEPALWESRPRDISFVLDSLQELQKRIPALAGKIDARHIGVAGHSMGAFTADAIAGALVDLPGRPASSFCDPRVSAVLLLSPQGPGEFGLTDHSWDKVSVPLMSMTGSLDSGARRQGPSWKKIPFDRSLPGGKFHVFVRGASHMSFITARALSPSRRAQGQAILGYVNSAALAFWDTYLKSDSAAKKYLESDALSKFSGGAVQLFRR
jgi:predicted dienelactone hydrolase